MIYYFVNDVCVLQFADSFDSVETAVGAFTFNTVVKIKNGYVSAETSVIAEKLAQVQQ